MKLFAKFNKKINIRHFHNPEEADLFVERELARRRRASILRTAQRITVTSAA